MRALTTATLLALSACSPGPVRSAAPVSGERTRAYLARLDLSALEARGVDFTSERYDAALRLGRPAEEVDPERDYDFERLEELELRLAGVDRAAVLRRIFDELTRGASSDRERHLAVLRFLQRVSFHNALLRPIRRDGRVVSDPLLLLECNEMRCEEVARLAVDLFEAGGWRARTVSFGGHVAAEVAYGGAWHYVEADACGGDGQSAFRPDGVIPAWRELAEHPEWLDALPYKLELAAHGRPKTWSLPVRSERCFFADGEPRRSQHYKTKRGPLDDGDFGWSETARAPVEWSLRERAPRSVPGAVRWRAVEILPEPAGGSRARLAWHPAEDADGDLSGYRVWVASRPRGWGYAAFAGDEPARAFWNRTARWDLASYAALFRPPPEDLDRIETAGCEVVLELPALEGVFVTVTAFDEYHERAGKTVYPRLQRARPSRAAGKRPPLNRGLHSAPDPEGP